MASQRGGGYDLALEKKERKREALNSEGRGVSSRSFLGNMMPARSAPMVRGGDPQSPESIGDLMTPTVGREPPPSSPEEIGGRTRRNMEFLRAPETQAMLAQFAQSLAGGGSIGSAFSSAMDARGEYQTAQAEAAHQQWEDDIKLGQYQLEQQKFLAQQQQDAAQLGISQGNLDVAKRSQYFEEMKAAAEQEFKEKQFKSTERTAKLTEQETTLDIAKKKTELLQADRLEKARMAFLGDEEGMETVRTMGIPGLLDTAGAFALMGDSATANNLIGIANAKAGTEFTPDIIEYERDVKAGYFKGSLSEYKAVQKRAGVPEPEISATFAKEAIDQSNMADEANAQARELKKFKELAITTPTGWSVPYTSTAKAVLLDLGIDIGEEEYRNTTMQQLFKKESHLLALKVRNPDSGYGLPGATSNFDIKFLLDSGPQLANLPEVNQAMLIGMEAKYKYQAILSKKKSDWISEHHDLRGWDAEEAMKDADVVSAKDMQYLQSLMDPEVVNPYENTDQTPAARTSVDVPTIAPTWLDAEDQANWNTGEYDENMKRKLLATQPKKK